jgi:hypothetical protein
MDRASLNVVADKLQIAGSRAKLQTRKMHPPFFPPFFRAKLQTSKMYFLRPRLLLCLFPKTNVQSEPSRKSFNLKAAHDVTDTNNLSD